MKNDLEMKNLEIELMELKRKSCDFLTYSWKQMETFSNKAKKIQSKINELKKDEK